MNFSEFLFSFLWHIEYPLVLFSAFFLVTIHLKKTRVSYLLLLIAFLVMEGFWQIRNIPGYLFSLDVLIYFVMYMFLIHIAKYVFKITLTQAIFVTAVAVAIQHMSFKLDLLICNIINPIYWNSWFMWLIYLISCGIVGALVYFLYICRFKNDFIQFSNKTTIIVSILIITGTVLLSFYTEDDIQRAFLPENNVVYAIIELYPIFACFAGISVLYLNGRTNQLMSEKNTLELLVEADKKRYEMARTAIESANIKYHDLKHHLNDTQAVEERKEMEGDPNYQALMYSGNQALDTIIVEKNLLASKQGCRFNCMTDGTLLNFMKSYQIYSLFGNLLDNAIDAAKECPEDKKTIRLTIKKNRGSILIQTENYTMKEPMLVEGLPQTTNADKMSHGFGTKSIKNIVDLYQGILTFHYEDNKFFATIIFPDQNIASL